MNLAKDYKDVEQPDLYENGSNEMTVAISSLSLGGAEKIVLDWAYRIYPRWQAHLIVLRDRKEEWPVPSFVKVTRLHGKDMLKKLQLIGAKIAAKPNPTCVCHLLNKAERDALSKSGINVIPVLHNAKNGWLEDVVNLNGSSSVIAVSQDCAESLRESGWTGSTSVIRHIPSQTNFHPKSREIFRKLWKIPQDAIVLGMIGAVKPQKNYSFALQVLKQLLAKRDDIYLVIVGGPVNTVKGRPAWDQLVEEIKQLGLRKRVAMPGFIPNASACLPAFDVMINTSHFEGLSIATLEALVNGIPVVANKVGGQGELAADGLILLEKDSPSWPHAIETAIGRKTEKPKWATFPSYRLWTLASLAHSVKPTGKVLFVAANLNSGGAQRSLVNLAKSIGRKLQFEIAVTGNSTADFFYKDLRDSGIKVSRLGSPPWDPFVYAENLVQKACSENFETICFWNVNASIKLLTVKALRATNVKFVDVSPGDYIYEEMKEILDFQQYIAFSETEYFSRIDKLVLKYHGKYPAECEGKVAIIPNGVPWPPRIKKDYSIKGNPKVAVCGRIAPTKFDVEIIEAMKIVWKEVPNAELHFFGVAEPYHEQYMLMVNYHAGEEVDKRIFFHGLDFYAVSKLPDFDIFVVLGENQGCPNAILEALSVGLPCIANDDGGTRELIISENTGVLMPSTKPEDVAYWIVALISKRDIAWLIGTKGRKFIRKNFSMSKMRRSYLDILGKPSLLRRGWKYLTEVTSSFTGAISRKEEHDGTTSYSLYRQRLPR